MMTLKERIRTALTEMDDSEIVNIWNEYCYTTNNFDDEIFNDCALEEMINNSQDGALYWVNRFFYGSDDYSKDGSANPNRNYFQFNGYGNIQSFDYIYNNYSDTFSYIDVDSLIDYIIDNNDSLYCDDIQEILDDFETEETEETETA